jgi:hypothetical protein
MPMTPNPMMRPQGMVPPRMMGGYGGFGGGGFRGMPATRFRTFDDGGAAKDETPLSSLPVKDEEVLGDMLSSWRPKETQYSGDKRDRQWPRRDDGGQIGGVQPSIQTQNPMMQNILQRYRAMPPEQLQELVVRLGNSSIGRMAQQVLNQKRTMNTAQQGALPQQQTQAPMAPQLTTAQQPPMKRGGTVKRDGGGGMSIGMEAPWWERQELRDSTEGGFLHGSTSGRADLLKTSSPAGSYILPADVVAGLGEGNSLAGARVIEESLNSGPHGIPMPRGARGNTMPRGARLPKEEAKGGGVQDAPGQRRIPVLLSHGEFQVSPHHVRNLGSGNINNGHRILDEFVKEVRKRTISKMKSLPGPAK